MQDRELHRRILGIEAPWYVDSVELKLEAGEIHVLLGQPMIEVARMLKRRFENISTYQRHRITNATRESINAKIQWVKYTARGFRNRQNFVHAIYFHCRGLDLASHSTKSPEAPPNELNGVDYVRHGGIIAQSDL